MYKKSEKSKTITEFSKKGRAWSIELRA